MLTIIAWGLLIFSSLSVIGKLLLKNAYWFEYFWIGFVALIVFLQIWSILLPVDNFSLLSVFGISLIGIILLRKKIKLQKINLAFLIVSFLVVAAISYYASQPVGWDDTYLYHLNAVKWSNSYPVVPGLGNLHSRLGFNSSFFLFAAILDNWIFDNRSSHLALFILTSVLAIEFLWVFVYSKNKALKLFCLLITPYLLAAVAKYQLVATLSHDFAASVLVIAASIQVLKSGKKSLIVAGLMALALVTVKFTAIVFSLGIIIFLLLKFLSTKKMPMSKHLYWFFPAALLILVPFFVRNIYLTGWIFYPLPVFGMPVDWAVPKREVKSLYVVITTWAKVPGTEWTKFIGAGFERWFPVWFAANKKSPEMALFIFSGIAPTIIFLKNGFRELRLKKHIPLFIVGLSSLLSVITIFFSAPDIRFGGIYVWIFFASVMTLFLKSIVFTGLRKIVVVAAFSVLVIFTSWPPQFDTKPILKSVRWEQAWPTEIRDGILRPTSHGLCGNSELPCSPEENNIRFRVPEDLSHGFAPN